MLVLSTTLFFIKRLLTYLLSVLGFSYSWGQRFGNNVLGLHLRLCCK